MLEFFPSEEHERLIQETALMLERRLGSREYTLLVKDGRKIPLEINGDVLRNEDGTPFGLVTVSRNISERKQAESQREALLEKLRESERKLREAQELAHYSKYFNLTRIHSFPKSIQSKIYLHGPRTMSVTRN
jgi:hypothetical protein